MVWDQERILTIQAKLRCGQNFRDAATSTELWPRNGQNFRDAATSTELWPDID